MKFVRADFRFALPSDFEGTALEALELAVAALRDPVIPELRATVSKPRKAELYRDGHATFYNNARLGHSFTGFVGAVELVGGRWEELASGVKAHGSQVDGWVK